jgi:tetratricopeptide (TPR) repeat protein
VQRADNQLRINAQLIDAKTGGHLWAERYDGKMDNIFGLQDKITQKIVSALAVKLKDSEQEQVEGKYTDNIEAYDTFLKGVGHAVRYTPNDTRQAIRYLKKAIELDPNYGRAHARLGFLYLTSITPWVDLPMPVHWIVPRNYLQAAMKNPGPYAHRLAALINLRLRRYKEAISEAERAMALAPNDPATHGVMASILNYAGRSKEAVKFAKLRMRNNPRQVHRVLWVLGTAHFSMGNLEQAVTYFERSRTHNPENYDNNLFLAATYSHLGREKEAREALENYYNSFRGWKPTLRRAMYPYPFKNPEVAERLAEGLIKAGLKGGPSGYYKILEENRLSGEEIRKLVYGREIRTDCPPIGVDNVNRTKDGTFEHAGYGPGKSRILDEMLCDKWDSRYGGLEYCGTVFQNPEGTPDTEDEYIYVTDFQICELSPKEGPSSGSNIIIEENRLSGEEIRELLFGRTVTGFNPRREMYWWIESSKDGKKIKYRNNWGWSYSGEGWLEGDLSCHKWEKRPRVTEDCFHIYRNPDGTPEKKNEYLFVGRDKYRTCSPID